MSFVAVFMISMCTPGRVTTAIACCFDLVSKNCGSTVTSTKAEC